MNADPKTGEVLRQQLDFAAMPHEELALIHTACMAVLSDTKADLGRIEMELRQRMEAAGATQLAAEGYEIVDKGSKVYDHNHLMLLLETLPKSVTDTAFTPEHEDITIVAASWDMRKVQHWGKKYGTEVADIVSKATTLLPGKISVKTL